MPNPVTIAKPKSRHVRLNDSVCTMRHHAELLKSACSGGGSLSDGDLETIAFHAQAALAELAIYVELNK